MRSSDHRRLLRRLHRRGGAPQPQSGDRLRYFTGAEQDALETQLTPSTREWRQKRVALARRGLEQLKTFERAELTDAQRVSADLMAWQLAIVVEGEKYEDFVFPLEQFNGVNINVVNALTIVHPLNTEKDAVNYVARLRQVAARMEEATSEAIQLAEKGRLPPRFILGATITQMEQFIGTPAAQNPFVAAFNDRMTAVPAIPAARREALRAQAEQITASQILPGLAQCCRGATAPPRTRHRRGGALAISWRKRGVRVFLRAFTSTDLTADEIHRIGLREVCAH